MLTAPRESGLDICALVPTTTRFTDSTAGARIVYGAMQASLHCTKVPMRVIHPAIEPTYNPH